MTTLLLALFACSGENERLTEDAFYDAYAKTACDQHFLCEPDSWRAQRGEALCQIEQENQARSWLGNTCSTMDLAYAEACLDEMAATACHRSLVEGEIPDACWLVPQFDDTSCLPVLDTEERTGTDRPPG